MKQLSLHDVVRPLSVKEFVRARLAGIELRNAARAERRRRSRGAKEPGRGGEQSRLWGMPSIHANFDRHKEYLYQAMNVRYLPPMIEDDSYPVINF